MSQGFILIHRKITDSDFWFSEKFTRGQAWVDLLLLANHKEGFIRKRGIRIDVSRGCVGVAQETLATRWKWSRGKVKRFLNELEKDEKIVQQTNKATSLICIVNYDEYQGKQTPNGTTDEHQTNIKRTSNSTGTTMNNNVNNDKQETKDMSGKPDGVKKSKFSQEAIDLLNILNALSGKTFRPVDTNLKLIDARLKSGIPKDTLHAMLGMMCGKWKGTDMEKFLRPTTLFGLEKCEQYIGEIDNKPTYEDK